MLSKYCNDILIKGEEVNFPHFWPLLHFKCSMKQ